VTVTATDKKQPKSSA